MGSTEKMNEKLEWVSILLPISYSNWVSVLTSKLHIFYFFSRCLSLMQTYICVSDNKVAELLTLQKWCCVHCTKLQYVNKEEGGSYVWICQNKYRHDSNHGASCFPNMAVWSCVSVKLLWLKMQTPQWELSPGCFHTSPIKPEPVMGLKDII